MQLAIMYRYALAIVASLLLVTEVQAATTVEMSITDQDLRKLPATATKVISWWNTNADCREVRGKSISLSDGRRVLFATTWPASCGWGNTNGPVLLLLEYKSGYKSILQETGIVVRPLSTTTNSFKDIEVIGSHVTSTYLFNGEQYVLREQRPDR